MMEDWVVDVDDIKDGGGNSLTEDVIMGEENVLAWNDRSGWKSSQAVKPSKES